MEKHKELLPTGLIISLVSSFVFLLIKDLLSRSQIINFFDRQGFNNIVAVLVSIFIAISLGLVWISFIKYRRKIKNRKKTS
jgi:uncharacterized BrkB/YihY/UPF0761 family membrane protein